MKAIAYRDLLALVCDGLGWDPNLLDASEFAQAKRAISAAIREVYDYCFWPDLTRTEQRTFWPNYDDTETFAAGEIVYYPPTDAYYIALRSTTGNEPATRSGDTWSTNEAYWSLALRVLSADEHDTTEAYARGAKVYDPITFAFYQCHTAAAAGIAATNTSYWGAIEPLDPVIPWTRTGLNPIGRVEGVYREDPRIHRGAEGIAWDETHAGIQVREGEENNPWIRYQLRPARFTGTTYDPAAAYTAVSDEDSVTTEVIDPVTGRFAIQGRAALRALTAHEDDEMQYLAFLVTAGDGNGGTYIFDASSTEVDNGVDYLKPDNITHPNPGRWIRSNNP